MCGLLRRNAGARRLLLRRRGIVLRVRYSYPNRSSRRDRSHSNQHSSQDARSCLNANIRSRSQSCLADGCLLDRLLNCLLRYRAHRTNTGCRHLDLLPGIYIH